MTAPETAAIRAQLSDGAYPIGWGHATILTLCDEVERLRGFMEDFADMKIEAIYPPPNPCDPFDVGDPVTDYLMIEALQEDARAALGQPTGDRP